MKLRLDQLTVKSFVTDPQTSALRGGFKEIEANSPRCAMTAWEGCE